MRIIGDKAFSSCTYCAINKFIIFFICSNQVPSHSRLNHNHGRNRHQEICHIISYFGCGLLVQYFPVFVENFVADTEFEGTGNDTVKDPPQWRGLANSVDKNVCINDDAHGDVLRLFEECRTALNSFLR